MRPLLKLLPRRIRHLMLAVTLLPLLLMALLLSALSIHTTLDSVDHQLRERGEVIATTLAASSELALFANDREQQRSLARQALLQQDVVNVTIFDRRGSMSVSAGNAVTTSIFRHLPHLQWRQDGIWYFQAPVYLRGMNYVDNAETLNQAFAAPVNAGPKLLGRVMIGLSDQHARQQALTLLLNNILISMAILILAILLALLLSRKVTVPLSRIMQALRALQQGRLDTRIKITASGELRELEVGINDLARRIQSSNEQLQEKVRAATAELEQAMRDLRTRNAELALARNEAEDANQAKGLFLARMSHELRTPLTSILGFTRMLDQIPEGEQRKEAIAVIQSASKILLTVIDDILTYSKLQARSIELEHIPFNLRDCIDDVLALLAGSASEKGLVVEVVMAPSLPVELLGDPCRLGQVFTNLINNAIKFTDHGQIRIDVSHVQNSKARIQLNFSITDTGIGISSETREKLFRPFTQADSDISRRYGGTGLGLVICQQLVRLMGGEIELHGEPDRGTRVRFSISLLQQPGAYRQAPVRPLEIDTALLFDAHPLSRLAATRLLQCFATKVVSSATLADLERQASRHASACHLIVLGLDIERKQAGACMETLRRIRERHTGALVILAGHIAPVPDTTPFQPILRLRKPLTHRALESALRSHFRGPGEDPVVTTGTQRQERLRVLLVEDNPLNRVFLIRLLETRGVIVTEADNAMAALALAANQSFDLILMDLHLPDIDGRECTRRIRATGDMNQHTSIFALTADLVARDDTELLAEGFNGVLMKPVDEQLLDAVLGLSEGDPYPRVTHTEMRHELRQQLARELESLQDRLQRRISRSQWLPARELAHQLNGLAGVYRLAAIQALAAQLEHACIVSDQELAEVLLMELAQVLRNQDAGEDSAAHS